jgi:hypothetical protein
VATDEEYRLADPSVAATKINAPLALWKSGERGVFLNCQSGPCGGLEKSRAHA